MSKNSIHNKNGSVSAYGLACGYVQTYKQERGTAELYREGGIYHVRMILEGWEYTLWNDRKGSGKQWQSFECLEVARAMFVYYCGRVDVGIFTEMRPNWPMRRWNADFSEYIDLQWKERGWPWLTAYADNSK